MRFLLFSIGFMLLLAMPGSSQDSQSPDYYIERGTSSWHHAKYFDAIADYTRAIELDEVSLKTNPGDSSIRTRLTDTYLKRAIVRRIVRTFDDAMADIDRTLEIHPKWAEAYYERGVTEKSAGDARAAIVDYTKAIEIDPRHARAYKDRGFAYQDIAERRPALEDFDTSIRIDSTDMQTYAFRANTREWVGDYDGALADYTKILDLLPDAPPIRRARGFLLLRLKRDAEAERDLAKYVQLVPQDKSQIEDLISRVKASRK